MKNVAQQVDKFQTQIDALEQGCSKIGIATRLSVKRQHSGTFAFVISLSSSRQRFQINAHHPSDTMEECLPSPIIKVVASGKRHQQIILMLKENTRTLTKSFTDMSVADMHLPLPVTSQSWLSKNFGTTMPDGTTYEMKECSGSKSSNWRFKITASAPASTQYFLIGYDEEYLFISLLPRAASSIEAAHRMLMPKEIRGKEGVLRQGEWFFAPINESDKNFLKKFHGDSAGVFNAGLYDSSKREDSDHYAYVMVPSEDSERQYVTGGILHTRHKELFLNGWYRVYRNTEKIAEGSESFD